MTRTSHFFKKTAFTELLYPKRRDGRLIRISANFPAYGP